MAQDNEYCLGAVPAKGRKGVLSLSLMLVMLGLTFFSASMWTGGRSVPGWCSMTSSRQY
ncbi:hypothetical protein [Aeromonas sobria]|uniref:hypothetical protein n=1 Tax=Aeromonas sobria TaxID=646 RepID=UPI001F002F80|nr:hypothetical protein [Aeromonas sobria]